MQTVEDVFWSGVDDARTLLHKAEKPISHEFHKVKHYVRSGERDVTREAKRIRRGAIKDLHHARGVIRHGVNDAKTSFNHVTKNLHKDWNKLDSFTRREYNNAANAISNGVTDVKNDFNQFTSWIGSSVNGAENDIIIFLLVGGVLLYVFREPVGTGINYLFNEGKSTAKSVLNNAAAAAPYAAPLLLL